MPAPVIKGVSQVMAHTPGLAQYGSKPGRELPGDAAVRQQFQQALRDWPAAVAYPPNQVFVGAMTTEELAGHPRPWYDHPLAGAERRGAFGEIFPEQEFLGWVKAVDVFDLVHLEENCARQAGEALAQHPLAGAEDAQRVGAGIPLVQVQGMIARGEAIPLHLRDGTIAGCLRHGRADDENLHGRVLLENLAAKASAVMAVRRLLRHDLGVDPGTIDYIINTGEEAVGDRYQRGAGNLAKAVGESCGCVNATGGDVKAFCCAPIHALVVAGSLVQAGVFRNVLVVGGGSMAKLGMKFQRHLGRGLPVMEDMLAAFAVLVGPDDGQSPVLRLDCVGKHNISAAASAEAIYQCLVVRPLEEHGLGLTDIDKYAVELHNPEVTETGGSGDVARTNYRIIAALAVRRGEIGRDQLESFISARGMPGFSPTQGHVPAAVPYLGHALRDMRAGRTRTAMLIAKGSLFLGMMTRLADGMSVLVERNPALEQATS